MVGNSSSELANLHHFPFSFATDTKEKSVLCYSISRQKQKKTAAVQVENR